MKQSTQNFVRELVHTVPTLQGLLEEHISDNDSLLPHVFLGDLTRYVIESYEATRQQESSAKDEEDLTRILSCLERGMVSGSEEVQELVAVSFLENLDESDESLRGLESMLGPALTTALSKLRGV